MSQIDPHKPVCVTGASGYLAVFVVRDLLDKGWTVHGTVRDPNNEAKVAPLKTLEGAAERLHLFAADLKTGGFEAALEGCAGCVHTACPMEIPLDGKVHFKSMEEVEEQQLKPAIEGTASVIKACAAMGVKRIVLTSSVAAMAGVPPPGHPLLDESCWSDEDFLKEHILKECACAYRLAKTLQEREATRLAKEHGLELRVINPSVIIGPMLTKHLNFSHEVILNILIGKGCPLLPPSSTEHKVQNGCLPIIDVREVSQAHVLALEDDKASGRYFLNSFIPHFEDIVLIALEKFPMLKSRLPQGIDGDGASDFVKKSPFKFSNSKCRELGVAEVALDSSLMDTIEALGGMGLLDLDERTNNNPTS